MSRNILVADPDPAAQERLRFALGSLGFTCEIVENGQLALERLHRGPLPEAVIIALVMPVMDGVAFRRAQLDDARLARVPTILATISAPMAGLERAVGMPVLTKPVLLYELALTLEQALGV